MPTDSTSRGRLSSARFGPAWTGVGVAWLLLAVIGCGTPDDERRLQSPEVQQRLAELEQREREAAEEAWRRANERLAQVLRDDLAAPANKQPPVAASAGKLDPSAAKVPQGAAASQPAGQVPAAAKVPEPSPVGDRGPSKVPVGPPSPVNPVAAWSELQAGMTAADVKARLGEPVSVSNDVYLVYWHYGAGPSAGKVALLRGSERLVAWEPPSQ